MSLFYKVVYKLKHINNYIGGFGYEDKKRGKGDMFSKKGETRNNYNTIRFDGNIEGNSPHRYILTTG